MLLNEKSKRIIQVLMHENNVTLQLLTLMLPYSKRTIEYELERIQQWLSDCNLPQLEMEGTSIRLLNDPRIYEGVERAELLFSEDERELLIIFYTLTTDEFLSSVHYQQLLDVSKFTVQESLNAVKANAAQFGLDFAYTRRTGYHVNGHPQTIALYLYRAVERLVELSTKERLISAIIDTWQTEHDRLIEQIESYERLHQFRFVESHREKLTYFLLLGSRLARTEAHDEEDVILFENTDESLREHFNQLSHLWVTLDMLVKSGPKMEEEMDANVQQNLSLVMMEVIERFETLSCTFIIEREALCEKLVLHSKATLQRVYTGLEAPRELERYVMKEHQVLNVLVDKSLEPFRKRIDKVIPKHEVMYYTLHFAAHLHRQGQHLDEKMKAIVVCPSGVSVSHMLDHILKNQFPEFVFLPPISQRDVERFAPLVDLVFTTVPLPRDVQRIAHVMLVPTLPTRLEQVALKREIGKRFLHSVPEVPLQLDEVMHVIEKYATVTNERQLRRELRALLNPNQNPMRSEGEQPVLNELITQDNVQLMERVSDWKEAIRLAARPLEENASIETRYIETMIANVEQHGPYVVLMPDVAIPHARPEDGVRSLGMSVLKLTEPVVFPTDKPVRLFFVLAAIDQTTHLKALAQLTELLGNEADLNHVLASKTIEDILRVVTTYSEEE
ncbi:MULTISPECIES: BglG family transcription antiterminator [Exiguobacterium]|uniref:BglG family transcription antiterminator n=1 Tax=Exiguobacterium TaxID=33986 RepID=UPI001BEAB66F|nr:MULTISPECIES: PTS sugar transporter subunit IIA [Exiguobacterium]MCT4781886.1 PTS sugar transporter subunit IIA [Exiguobacterium himgiriensis]